MKPRAALLIMVSGVLLCATGCEALSDVSGPASRASRMRASSRGGRVMWMAGDKPLGKWRVERQHIKVYDAAMVHVGDVSAEQDASGALLALNREQPGQPASRLVPTQDRWTLSGEEGARSVTLEDRRLVVSDAQGQQLGEITQAAGALLWTSFETELVLSARAEGGSVTVKRGDEVALRALVQHVVPADALVQLIPGFGALDRACLAMIVVEWSRRHKG
jgi:hypothetical protein